MLFSIIIPTYNRIALLQKTIQSVFAQKFTDFELIVVDDGSTDGTLAYLKSLGSRVHILTQSNKGPGEARNLGVTRAHGDYVAFLDSDDLWFPWTLETYYRLTKQFQKPAFIAGKPLRFSDEFELRTASVCEVCANAYGDYLQSGDEWRWWGVSSFVIRRDAFDTAGGFTKEWINGEDADLAMRLGTAPGFVQIVDPVTFGYREHATSAMKNFSKTLAGTWHGLRTERNGQYPGGGKRARERRRIISRHARPVAFDCLTHGQTTEAWRIYTALLGWNLALGRWKFLAGFPVRALLSRPR